MNFWYQVLEYCFPFLTFRGSEKAYYLTIDDSPSSDTMEILDVLDQYKVKARFFCIGKNIEQYPDAFLEIKLRGHQLGYHSYDHRSLNTMSYHDAFNDFKKCRSLFKSQYYRPPYGSIHLRFFFYLFGLGKKIIFWNRLMEDWKVFANPEEVAMQKIKNAPFGSIFVFHDNEKSITNCKIMLNIFLQYAHNQNIKVIPI